MHDVTIAGSRSGKGRSCIINNLISYPGSVLAVDPKSELANKTALHRANLKQNVCVMDPFGIAKEGAEKFRRSFNPLEHLDADKNLVEDAGLIADALVIPEEGGKNSHWDETARQFIEGIILHVATATKYEGERNLVTVYRLLASVNDALREEMDGNMAANNAVVEAAGAFFQKPDNERESVLSTARRHVRFLGYESMQKVLSGPSINLRELKTKGTTIYLCLPAMRLGTCSRWLRLFVNMTLAAMEEEETKPVCPVLLCLDEFAVLGHMKTIEDAAGQIAGLGCKLWPILQDLGQLKALYRDRWETFLGNAGIVQCFGNSDLTTLEWISKRLGETTVRTQTVGSVSPKARAVEGMRGDTFGSAIHSLLTPEEVSRFFGRDDHLLRQLIIVAGYTPLVLQRAFWDRHEIFVNAVARAKAEKRVTG